MSCRPPCCKRDPERQCPICFTDQTWAMEIPSPIVFENSVNDKIVDGAGDASVGTCGGATGRDGSNGYDSHTYIDSKIKGRSVPDYLEKVGTEDGDSLSRNPPALWDETLICNQFIGDRIYGVTHIKNKGRLTGEESPLTMPFIHNLGIRGEFYIPSAPVLSGTFTKTFQFRTGADRGSSNDSLWDRIKDDDFKPSLSRRSGYFIHRVADLSEWRFYSLPKLRGWLKYVADAEFGPVPQYQVENGDDISDDDYTTKSLNDRRVFLTTKIGNQYKYYDTGLTLGDYIDGGTFIQIEVEQTAVEPILDGVRYLTTSNVTHRIPESGFEITEEVVDGSYRRCDNGLVRLYSYPSIKNQFWWPIDGPFKNDGISNNGWRVANHDPAWWINEINRRAEDFPEPNEDKQFLMLLPWINEFEISNGSFSDTANFIVVRLLHKNTSGEIKNAFYAADYNGVTIPDGETVDVGEVETGDTFELGLDNLGEVTTECSSITIDNPFLIAIDDSSPTLLPYDFTTVTITGAPLVVDGTADIVITHDQGGTIIPSPWTITLSGTAPLPAPP